MSRPTERFSSTVEFYQRYRPHYPSEIVRMLIEECGLNQHAVIADVGSGTGFLAEIFLKEGYTVCGVEPNQDMRLAGEAYLSNFSNFNSIDATAEHTSLKNNSIDLITVGTAFHWFKQEEAKYEFKRILKVPGYAALLWNVRDMQSVIIREFEALLNRYCPDYSASQAKEFESSVNEDFFSPYSMKVYGIRNQQFFNWEGFVGRLRSTSYCLQPKDHEYEEMLQALRKIYDRYKRENLLQFEYECKIYYGRMK